MPVDPLPLDQLQDFIQVFDIEAPHITVTSIDPERGIGLRLTSAPHNLKTPILTVPKELLLCSTNVEIASKSDKNLAAALDAVPQFSSAARGRIMVFLALRMLEGARDAWSEYIRFLPTTVPVPTLWPEPARHLLSGTSLYQPTEKKLYHLTQERTTFVEAVMELPWFSQHIHKLTLQDWILNDALLRSRYIRLPEPIGDTMVPVLDFANHSHPAVARYDYDEFGDAVLVLNPNVEVKEGMEITIDYSGGEKSASEMLYTYGFIPKDEGEGRGVETVRLFLECQEDDPLGPAKRRVFNGEQTVTLLSDGSWKSDWIWLTLLNTEDTLYFRVVATTTGERTLEVLFNKHPITSFTAEDFVNPYLRPHPHFPIFHLRAVVLLLQKLEEHIEQMERAENAAMRMGALGLVAEDIVATTGRLRDLEGRIMMKARDKLEKQRDELLQDPTVLEYLRQMQGGDPGNESTSSNPGVESGAITAASTTETEVQVTETGEPDLS